MGQFWDDYFCFKTLKTNSLVLKINKSSQVPGKGVSQ